MKPENCESIKENLGSTQSSGYNSNTSDEGLQIMSPKNTSRLKLEDSANTADEKVTMEQIEINEKLIGSPVLERIIESQYEIDTVLSCRDGKVGAHRIVLASASPFLECLLADHDLGELATIVLPDIPVKVMTLILHFCYNGQVVFPLELQKEIYDDMEYLMIGTGKELYIKKVITQPPSNSNLTLQANPAQALEKLEENTATTPLVRFPSPDSETEIGSDSETECETEVEKEISISNTGSSVFTIGPDRKDRFYRCMFCDYKNQLRSNLVMHIKNQHNKETKLELPTSADMTSLSFCPECKVQHLTLSNCDGCLKKHQMARCYTCFGVFLSDQLIPHYKDAHGIKSKYGFVSPCRWCDIAIGITDDGSLLRNHAINSHTATFARATKKISSSSPVKRRKAQKSSTSNSNTRMTRGLSMSTSVNPSSSVLPFVRIFQQNLYNSNRESQQYATEVKKRKHDEHGKPLQVAKRSKGPPTQREGKILRSTTKYNKGILTIHPNSATRKIPIDQVPKVHVHLNLQADDSEEEVVT
ncbi:uncharacterized protein LOC110862515 isoform X1 [Folsomia candida]|uniref:Transcription factor Ken 1 n=2 Tax=Folsomia candida TaxID=158441 RepID=A0A226CWC7_FOLCA|nr:uncharacterized protein LOC110862515 isoform X1 [Folsomia candida]XP_035701519.1 uncharacterized protein LOC110862515 isoform X1 [Folsomia candida]XP_035701520.1 uncharacterized protein LOC110862515 isoform X1 [Folsomia candida]XP_035701521.1 uncharacterized protein LOC110862515 isoform X1 [Folsomia candida]XP_035701522.1 uncharacterized protein LOC110862515 isoform X1 [Folsomia candida]XP_035701523.1 uncharacterized protein LOC110862515 isoform X1 [Folsomia candida]XP_035701524.1 uncharac